MFPEFMLYNFDMEPDERIVDIKARCLPFAFRQRAWTWLLFFLVAVWARANTRPAIDLSIIKQ